jgi:2-iminobutanoate/2-iminopropanoate deaminase
MGVAKVAELFGISAGPLMLLVFPGPQVVEHDANHDANMDGSRQVIRTNRAPVPNVPISQAIKAGGMVFCSGFIPQDPSGKLVGGDIEVQTDRVFQNLKAVLEAAGSSLEKVVKVTVFLSDKQDFTGMNKVFGRYFPNDPPARSTVQVGLLVDARIEIELVAIA